MVVALYTSRVVLNALGVEDYGLYGVVGGIVVFFNVISGSLNAAISRFITFELGKGEQEHLNKVFCTAVNIQLLMSVLFVVLAEIVGVWFLNNHLNVPEGRLSAAHWVLQRSNISFAVGLLSVPYNSTIIAHERMDAYAYISILSTFLNLGVALVIDYIIFDKLIFYAFAILGINVIMQFIYVFYCRTHFPETRWRLVKDKVLLKEMTSFAGWNFLGASSGVLMGQGVNMLMNVFFGVAVNAARGIAGQVDNAINMLVNNFTVALNPQITKSYASGDLKYMHDLVCKGAKYSFFIMLLPSLPILLETETILQVWLKQVPEMTVVFLRLTILISLNYVLSQTLITAMLATGKIKQYQIIISSLSYLIFVLVYIAFKIGLPSYSAYIIHFIVFSIQLFVRVILLKKMISMSIARFFNDVIARNFVIFLVSSIIPAILFFTMSQNLYRLTFVFITSVICSIITIIIIGLSQTERLWLKHIILNKFNMMLGEYNDKK